MQPQVKPAATVTSLTSSANPAPADDETTITASLKNSNTAATPFGSVQFLIDGKAVIEPLRLAWISGAPDRPVVAADSD